MSTALFSAAVLMTIAIMPVAMAQSASDPANEAVPSEVQEEITVYGRKSIIQLRVEFQMAQKAMFDIFNALNSDDKFDVECGYEVSLGSYRRHYVCTPRFLTHGLQDTWMGATSVRAGENDPSLASPRVRRLNKQLWDEMAVLARDHPQLREAVTDLAEVKEEYNEERERRSKTAADSFSTRDTSN